MIDSGGINAMTLTPDKSRVIVGGRFTKLNGISTGSVGSVDAVHGTTMPFAFGQDEKNGPDNASGIYALAADDKYVYGTGWAYGSGNFEGAFAADPTTGRPTWVEDCWGDTYTVAPINGVVYTGSHEHDCSSGGLWPSDGDHHHAQAWSVVPSSVHNVIDGRGWDYSAFQRPNLFNFKPVWQVGTYTGQNQAVWNIAASGNYVVMGGEFLAVNGIAQQGLVRFTTHAKAPNAYGPTTASLGTISAGTVQVNGHRAVEVDLTRAAFDPDDTHLTYQLVRNGATTTPVVTTTVPPPGWWEPNAGVPVRLVDTAPPAQPTSYQVLVRDGGGKTISTNTVKIGAGPRVLGVSPSSVAFGSLATGSSAQDAVTVSNPGPDALTVSTLTGPAGPSPPRRTSPAESSRRGVR